MASIAALRAIITRLDAANPSSLLRLVVQLAQHLQSCRDLLSLPPDILKKTHPQAVSLVTQLKSHIDKLLQSRIPENHFSAIILIKATVEASGHEILSKCGPWLHGLLEILKKSNLSPTRALSVSTLTRVFMLTWPHATLLREITTPVLPTFVAICLKNIEAMTKSKTKRCSAEELRIVLNSFAVLIERHVAIFRPFEARIRELMGRILTEGGGREGLSVAIDEDHRRCARRLLVLLCWCAPKSGGGPKWEEMLRNVITATHESCDRLFRGFSEVWRSSAGVVASVAKQSIVAGEIGLESDEVLGLKGWSGIYDGAERVVGLLRILEEQLRLPTSMTVNVRLGLFMDLLARICGLTSSTKANGEVAQDERQTLMLVLPGIHAAAIDLASTILRQLDQQAIPIVTHIIGCVRDVALSELSDEHVRLAAYQLLGQVVTLIGPVMTKTEVSEIEIIIKACCTDLLKEDDGHQIPDANAPFLQTNGASQRASRTISSSSPSKLETAAVALLPILLSKLHSTVLTPRIRIQMERTAVLTKNKDALVASVLNPIRNPTSMTIQPSLMPLLARQFPACLEVEALIRPRMPMIRARTEAESAHGDDDVGEEEEENEIDESQPQTRKASSTDEISVERPAPSSSTTDTTRAGEQVQSEFKASLAKQTSTVKRLAVDDQDADTARSPKRLRVPDEQLNPAEHVEPNAEVMDSRPSEATRMSVDPLPTGSNATFTTAPSQETVIATAVETAVSEEVTVQKVVEAKPHDDDGSDFDMPPLTMDQDTESESDPGDCCPMAWQHGC